MGTGFDVIVVGARRPGAPTAMLLARRGHRVLLVDRASFPSDTMSTHFIHNPGIAALARWGLLDLAVAGGCPPVTRYRFDMGPFALEGRPHCVPGATAAYCPRRTVLDAVLVGAAAAAGAEVRQRFMVDELVCDGDRVVGVRGHQEGGPAVSERAAVVVGADGVHSFLGRSVGAPLYHDRPPLAAASYTLERRPVGRRVRGARPSGPVVGCLPHRRRPDVHRHVLAVRRVRRQPP